MTAARHGLALVDFVAPVAPWRSPQSRRIAAGGWRSGCWHLSPATFGFFREQFPRPHADPFLLSFTDDEPAARNTVAARFLCRCATRGDVASGIKTAHAERRRDDRVIAAAGDGLAALAMYQAAGRRLNAATEPTRAVRAVLITGQRGHLRGGNDIGDFMQPPPGRGSNADRRFAGVPVHACADRIDKPVVAAVTGRPSASAPRCCCIATWSRVRRGGWRCPFVGLGLVPEFGSSLLVPCLMGMPRRREAAARRPVHRPSDAVDAASPTRCCRPARWRTMRAGAWPNASTSCRRARCARPSCCARQQRDACRATIRHRAAVRATAAPRRWRPSRPSSKRKPTSQVLMSLRQARGAARCCVARAAGHARLPAPPARGRRGSHGASARAGLRLLITGDSSAAGVGVVHQKDALAGQLVTAAGCGYRGATVRVAAGRANQARQRRPDLDLLQRGDAAADVAVVVTGVNDVVGRCLRTGPSRRESPTGCAMPWAAARGVRPLPPVHHFPGLPQPLRCGENTAATPHATTALRNAGGKTRRRRVAGRSTSAHRGRDGQRRLPPRRGGVPPMRPAIAEQYRAQASGRPASSR